MNPNGSGVSGSTDDTDSLCQKKRKKEKRSKEKKRRKKEKKKRKRRTSDSELENHVCSKHKKTKKSKDRKPSEAGKSNATDSKNVEIPGPSVPPELLAEQSKSRAPMTKEEWEKNQNVIRRVYDETTGRTRLVKGDGEILEEIVSRDRHRDINKQATAGDGAYFQSQFQTDRK